MAFTPTIINSFADLPAYLTSWVTVNNIPVGRPHFQFWNNLSYQEFINGTVPGVQPPVPILIVGNGLESNLVQALLGIGPLFNPNTGSIGQMPFGGPYMQDPAGPPPAPLVQPIIDWINNGCPE